MFMLKTMLLKTVFAASAMSHAATAISVVEKPINITLDARNKSSLQLIEFLQSQSEHFSDVTSLTCKYCSDDTVTTVAAFFGQKLKSITIDGRFPGPSAYPYGAPTRSDCEYAGHNRITNSAILDLVKHCPNLEKIDLFEQQNITTEVFPAIAVGLPNLKELNIGCCRQFKQVADILPLAYCPQLKELDIMGNPVAYNCESLHWNFHSLQEKLSIPRTRLIF